MRVFVASADLGSLRVLLRGLRRPGQRRLHFSKENARRRREVLGILTRGGLRARIYTCRAGTGLAREACIRGLAADLVELGVVNLTLESLTQEVHDRRLLAQLVIDGGAPAELAYQHLRPHEEPLLWVADAFAWAFGAGRDWRGRIEHVLDRVRDVTPRIRETRLQTVRRRVGSTSSG